MSPEDKLAASRMKLFFDHPFYATITLSQRLVTNEPSVKTMAVDGRCLYVNLNFVMSLPIEEVVGTFCHEDEHLARKHHIRRGTREPRLWNISCDGTINYDLIKMGLKLPKGIVCLRYLGNVLNAHGVSVPWVENRTAEEIYERLHQDRKEGKLSPEIQEMLDAPDGEFDFDVLDLPEDMNPADAEATINVTIHEAAMIARQKSQGKLPHYAQRILDEMAKPRVVWQDWVRERTRAVIPTHQSWSRVHRRVPGLSPGMVKSGLGQIVIFQDTSGSMSATELAYSRAEVISLMEELMPEMIYFVACDSVVHGCTELGPNDTLDVSAFVGGGGSDFRPAFQWVEENLTDICLGIVLSDMQISFPADAPAFPIIGVTTTNTLGPQWMTTIQREKHHAE